ncbi:MAG: hypothetical protein ACREUM_03795 [Nitrosospira sp.]
MRKRAILSWLIVVIAVSLAVAAVVVIVSLIKDPPAEKFDRRAYKVNGGEISLKEGLRRADIRLPRCLERDLKYALIDNGFGYYYDIYLKLQASADCVNSFLAANAMRDFVLQTGEVGGADAERRLNYRPAWMKSDLVAKMGWEIGPQQRFQKFGVGKSNLYSVTALVQQMRNPHDVRAYVYAFRGG